MVKHVDYIKIWLLSGIVLISIMVIVGGTTRLTNSGLSMVEWDVISGAIPPMSQQEWEVTFEKYKQFPEYKKLNSGMDLSGFKKIFWWEFIHRNIGRAIGVFFMIPFLFFYFSRWLSKPLILRLLFILILGALQGAMGWYMVKSGLVDRPHVSHFRLAAHLSLTLILIGVILWTYLELHYGKGLKESRKVNMTIPYLCIFLLFVQIILGAFVAGLKAGFTYNNFPWMGQSFFPSQELISIADPINNGVLMQFIHRWVAFIVLGVYYLLYRMTKSNPLAHKYAIGLLIIIGAQVGLGILTLMMSVPVFLGVLHQFVAVLAFIYTIIITYQLQYNVEPVEATQDQLRYSKI